MNTNASTLLSQTQLDDDGDCDDISTLLFPDQDRTPVSSIRASSFQGTLKGYPPVELVRALARAGRDAEVDMEIVAPEPGRALLYLSEGNVVHASFGGRSGVSALLEVLKSTSGVFVATWNRTTCAHNVDIPTARLVDTISVMARGPRLASDPVGMPISRR
jgi:hypothetical protein